MKPIIKNTNPNCLLELNICTRVLDNKEKKYLIMVTIYLFTLQLYEI